MATTINLYPPMMNNTFAPAFLIDSEMASDNVCRVYFALSIFNVATDIKNVQISVRDQVTNASALDSEKYPSEIKLATMKVDSSKTTNDKYYIEILPSDMENGNFVIDRYYKVQLRFTSATLPQDQEPSLDLPQAIDSWLSTNLRYFSEWSTVCLIRGISVPFISLKDFGPGMTEVYSTIANIDVIGKLYFSDPDEEEYLQKYNVKLYDINNNLLLSSGDIYTSDFTDVNAINYSINYTYEVDNTYFFTVEYTTNNLYTETVDFMFLVVQAETDPDYLEFTKILDEENGRIGINITRSSDHGNYTGKIIIRRTSSQSNFKIWDEMYIQSFNDVPYIDFTWYDYTVESGELYWYGIQSVNEEGARSSLHKDSEPTILNFEHIFLTSEDKQLVIKFNPSIASFKKIISESKIETIGSKYPFIKRNGYIDYAQFPIGGLISSEMDEEGIFTTKEAVFGDGYNYYNSLPIDNHFINQDYVYEKKFRDKVQDFLYNTKVKLFRSPTEGNFLIKLMDIQFQPNQTLGRRLWSFTAIANEIDECSIDNYDKYNIVSSNGDAIKGSGGGDNPSPLIPIRKIIFINNVSEFPSVGSVQVLYVFNKQIYIWDAEREVYVIISIPIWNETPISPINGQSLLGSYGLYTDNTSIYQWNNQTNKFEVISEPTYNIEFQEV